MSEVTGKTQIDKVVPKNPINEYIDHIAPAINYWWQKYQKAQLTIDDIERIHTFLYAVKNNKEGAFTFTRLSDKQYEEVLKRFNNYKK